MISTAEATKSAEIELLANFTRTEAFDRNVGEQYRRAHGAIVFNRVNRASAIRDVEGRDN
jgi:hypothetical protein